MCGCESRTSGEGALVDDRDVDAMGLQAFKEAAGGVHAADSRCNVQQRQHRPRILQQPEHYSLSKPIEHFGSMLHTGQGVHCMSTPSYCAWLSTSCSHVLAGTGDKGVAQQILSSKVQLRGGTGTRQVDAIKK